MAFPLLTTGLINSVTFGCYSNALSYLTQSRSGAHSQRQPASAAQVFAAGCFSGLMQVRLHPARHAQALVADHPFRDFMKKGRAVY